MVRYYEQALASQAGQFHKAVRQQHQLKVRNVQLEANSTVDHMRGHTPLQAVPVVGAGPQAGQ